MALAGILHGASAQCRSSWQDIVSSIACHSTWTGEVCLWTLKDVHVKTVGIGGATIAHPKPIFPTVWRLLDVQKFKILVLDVGSNDLDISRHPNLNLQYLARGLVNQAKDLGSKFKVEITLCLPIPRAEAKFPGSFETTRDFNELVSGMVKDLRHIHV